MANASAAKKKADFKAPKIDLYQWKGVNKRGEQVAGEIRAQTINEAKALLRSQGVIPAGVKKKPKPLLNIGGGINAMDIAVVTRQIATMLTAGVPLVQSIEMIGKGHEKEQMRELMANIKNELSAGRPLTECLRQHPRYFDDLYCDLVSAGEQSGALDSIYGRIATYKEKAEALKSKIKKALFYPAAVVVVAIIVTSILLIYVVPQFEEIFKGFGAELPAFTQLVIRISHFMQEYWWVALGIVIAAGYAYKEAALRSQNVQAAIGQVADGEHGAPAGGEVQLLQMADKDHRPDIAHELGDPEPHIGRTRDQRGAGMLGIDRCQIVGRGRHDQPVPALADIDAGAVLQGAQPGLHRLAMRHQRIGLDRAEIGHGIGGADDRRIASAAAEIAFELGPDRLLVEGMALAVHEVDRGHDHAGLTVSALRHVQIQPCLLDRVAAVW